MSEPLDPTAIMCEHSQIEFPDGWLCDVCKTGSDRRCLSYRLAAALAELSDEERMPAHVQAFATREDRHEIARWVRAALAGEQSEPKSDPEPVDEQAAALARAKADAWAEGYSTGIEDERAKALEIMGYWDPPNRANPYRAALAGEQS